MTPHGLEYTLYTIKVAVGFMGVLMALLAIAWMIERRVEK